MSAANEEAARAIRAARTALVLDQPFFGALALRLKIVEDPGCGTAWVDGVSLGYDPAFVESLTHAERVALLAHEVMHCALGHPWRRSGREKKGWNVATDYAINLVLTDSGFTLPEGGLLDRQWEGRSAEWIYDRLPRESPESDESGGEGGDDGDDSPSASDANGGAEDDESGDDESESSAGAEPDDDGEGGSDDGDEGEEGASSAGDGDSDDDSSSDDESEAGPEEYGEVRDAPADADESEATEEGWRQAVAQAAALARSRGSLPGGAARFAEKSAEQKVDWRSVLRRFVSAVARSDYSWTRPNARYVGRGLYLPGLRSEEMGPMAVMVDTSGSIDDVTLAQFEAEINAIAEESKPESIDVIYCDAEVNGIDHFERGDPIELHHAGGGGTAFAPAFRAIDDLEAIPTCAVYLTDLLGSFPDEEPDYPVLWVSTWGDRAPFGEVVPLT